VTDVQGVKGRSAYTADACEYGVFKPGPGSEEVEPEAGKDSASPDSGFQVESVGIMGRE